VQSGPKRSVPPPRDTESPLLRSADDFGRNGFERLRMSQVEAEQIGKLAPPGQTTTLTGFRATPAAFRRADVDRYSVIHVAAHTLLDNLHPELSGLVLSLVDREGKPQDGFLRLFDVYQMRLRADLVVLSACETSIGREMRGEGMLGLSRGFLAAGSRRVLSSLWKVDDRATAEFMRQFYTALLGRRLAPAEAVAAAQKAMREDPAWRSPYYWAPFVLQGDF
jgi:CHAT domain-containing protein